MSLKSFPRLRPLSLSPASRSTKRGEPRRSLEREDSGGGPKRRENAAVDRSRVPSVSNSTKWRAPFAKPGSKALAATSEGKEGKDGGEGARVRSVSAVGNPSVGFQLFPQLPNSCDAAMSSEASSTATAATAEVKYRSTDVERPKQFKHWVRPRSALYSYLYDYHRNYYDDVLDYLDRRRRGIVREIPRPQTWAERALRTYTQKLGATENAIKARNDQDLIHKVHRSRVMHDYHSKDYYAKRFTMAAF